MVGDKIVILHILCDSIWFDKVYPFFEEMEKYENYYLLRDIGVDKSKLKYISNKEKIICASSLQEWGETVGNPQNDVIYLQGLWKDSLKAIDYIRAETVVMWWCFGQEIYDNEYGWAPLLPLRVYKPRTFFFILKHSKTMRSFFSKSLTWTFPRLYDALQSVRYRIKGKRKIHQEMLRRIDFAFTPLPIELEEMKKRHRFLKAKPYEIRDKCIQYPFVYQERVGNLLFDHSAMSNNNHLDLLAALRQCHLRGRDVYLPLSYGNKSVADYMIRHASLDGAKMHFLTEIIPQEEYNELLSHCSHALFGTIRQSGLGNTYLLLRMGVKLFFFEDSIVYKQYKREGYHVFSIEKDLNDEAISTPLSYEMALHNYNLFYKNRGAFYESYQQQFDRILSLN